MPVTLTLKVQEVLGARVAPERLTALEPAVAVIVPPPQEPVRPFGVEMIRPDGRVFATTIPVKAIPDGFAIKKVSDVDPPTGIDAVPNAIEIVGPTRKAPS